MTNSITNNIENGVKLLNEAVSAYRNGNMSAAYEKYQQAGKFLSEANEFSKTEEGKTSMKYGWNSNFGVIYKVFENNTKGLLKNKSGKKHLSEIIKTIRENKVLNDEFAAYNAFTNPVNVSDTEKYVSESVNLVKHYSPETLKENNDKLISLFRKCQLDENIVVDDKEQQLFENIEYIITTPKKLNNVEKYANIHRELCEHVDENNVVINEKVNIDEMHSRLVEKTLDKYVDQLSEDEVNLLYNLKNDDAKSKKIFRENKEKVLQLLEREMLTENETEKAEWQKVYENVKSKEYDRKNCAVNVAEFIELRNTLETD